MCKEEGSRGNFDRDVMKINASMNWQLYCQRMWAPSMQTHANASICKFMQMYVDMYIQASIESTWISSE